jgi:cation-transporting ATPase E
VVRQRVDAGLTNAVEVRTSRTVLEIVRANVLTFFNFLLGALLLAVLVTGRWQNGLFGLVIVANSTLGIVQEVRAKRVLDRLAVLNAPKARVVRDGEVSVVDLAEVVQDDLLELQVGDQVPADGVVQTSSGLEVDESLLTGESEQVAKPAGASVRSGSFVVAGRGRFQATDVGENAYATRLATEARRFTLVHSELAEGTTRILRWISLVMLVVGPLLLWSQFRSKDNHGWRDAVTGTVAGMVGMVPEGLLLLTSLAFVVATVTLARQKVLVQELPAVEVLARVDVVCLDKTGTLTYGDIAFDQLVLLGGVSADDAAHGLAQLASADTTNTTEKAIAAAFPAGAWTPLGAVPFDSSRKWSAVETDGHGTWVLGAPEMVLPTPATGAQQQARTETDRVAASGSRVLLLARTATAVRPDATTAPRLPADLEPVALVLLSERVREDAAETLAYFTAQGVTLKVISGDNPRTVGAVARTVGVPGADRPVDARELPEDPEELADVLEGSTVFGRVTPQQKRAMVAALQRRGHVVAMTGDGVNDALALKDADIGIAMGNGSPATRAVAQIVLLDGRFAQLPSVVAEGRRVIANIERAASLFLIKNTYSLVLALVPASTLGAYPLAPIQLTLISILTIGLPGFALALAPNAQRYVPGFVRRVLRFSVPIGVVTAAAAYTGYRTTRLLDPGSGVAGGRTTATVVVVIVSLWTVGVLARPLNGWKLGLVAVLSAFAAVDVFVPALARDVYLLRTDAVDLGLAAAIGCAGALFVEITHRAVAARAPSVSGRPTSPAR